MNLISTHCEYGKGSIFPLETLFDIREKRKEKIEETNLQSESQSYNERIGFQTESTNNKD